MHRPEPFSSRRLRADAGENRRGSGGLAVAIGSKVEVASDPSSDIPPCRSGPGPLKSDLGEECAVIGPRPIEPKLIRGCRLA